MPPYTLRTNEFLIDIIVHTFSAYRYRVNFANKGEKRGEKSVIRTTTVIRAVCV